MVALLNLLLTVAIVLGLIGIALGIAWAVYGKDD